MPDNEKKLIGELRIGYDQLVKDVQKVNQELAKINQGEKSINLNVGLSGTNQELDKITQKYKVAADGTQKLLSETKVLTDEYGKQTKLIEKFNEKTQQVERTTKELTQDNKKLGAEMASARDKYINKLHTEALQINKQINAEATKKESALKKQQQLEMQSAAKIVQERKKHEEKYEQWWLKNLKERELKETQSARKVAQQQLLESQKLYASQFQAALQARQGISLFGGNTMGSGDARASVTSKVANSLIYSMSAMGISAMTSSIENAIDTNKNFELGLVDLSRTLENVTQNDLKAYGQQAVQFAKDFAVPLQEVQSAMTELARAGVDNKADLEIMIKSVLTGLNTTEINSAAEMTGYLISAVKQLGMEFSDSMKIIDSWNKLSDKYAVQSNDFAEAIQKAGSASKTLGLDINDVNAMVVMLGEATQASGMEIGQAMKSLEVRLLRPDTVKTLESYGIAVKKDAEHFLSFQQIMENVSNATKNLSDDSTQLNDIMDALGGSWRRNWAQILTQDWDRFEQLSKESVDSFGYSVAENEKVLGTFDAQIKRFQATMAEVYISLGQDGGILGQLQVLLQGVTSLADAFAKSPPFLKKYIVLLVELTATTKLFSMGLKGLTGVGLSEWLTRILQGSGKFLTAQTAMTSSTKILDKALKTGKITNQEYAIIQEMVASKIGVANVSTKALNISQQTLRRTQLLLSLSTLAVNAAIGAGLIVLTMGITAIAQYIDKQKRLGEIVSENISKAKDETKSVNDAIKEYEELKNKTSLTVEEKEKLVEVTNKIKMALPGATAVLNDETKAIAEQAEALRKLNTIKELNALQKNYDENVLPNYDKEQKTKESFKKQQEYYQSVLQGKGREFDEEYHKQLSKLSRAEGYIDTDALENIAKLEVLDKATEQLKKIGIELDALAIKENVSRINASEVYKTHAALKGMDEESIRVLDKKIAKMFEEGKSLNEIEIAVNSLIVSGEKLTDETIKDTKISSDSVTEATQSVYDYAKAAEESNKALDGTQSSLKSLADLYKQVADGQELNSNQMIDLIQDYPEVLSYMDSENNLMISQKELLKILFELKKQDMIMTLQAEKDKTDAVVKGMETQRDAYLGFYKAMGSITGYSEEQAAAMFGFDKATYDAAVQASKGYQAKITALENLKFKDFDSKTGTTTKKDTEIYIAKLNQFQKLEDALARINFELERNNILSDMADDQGKKNLLTERISLLKQEQTALHNLAEERRKAITQNVSKLSAVGFSVSYDSAANQLTIQNMERLNQLKGKDIEATNKLRKEYEDLIKETLSLNSANQDAGKEWWNVAKEIQSTQKATEDLVKAQKEAVQELISAYFKPITKSINEQIDAINDLKDAAKEAAEAQIKPIQDEIDRLEKVNDILKEQEDRQKRISDLAKQRELVANIQEQRNVKIIRADGTKEYIADPKALYDAQEKLKEMETDYAKWETETARKNHLDSLQEDIKRIQDDLKTKEKGYDEDIKSLQRYLKEQEELIDFGTDKQITSWKDLITELNKLGTTYETELTKAIEAINKYNAAVLGMATPGSLSTVPVGNTGNNSSGGGSSGNSYDDVVAQMKANSAAHGAASDAEKKRLANENLSLGQSIGWTRSSSGVWYKPDGTRAYDSGGLARGKGLMLKDTIEPERVLSPQMTKSFDRLVDYIGELPDFQTENPFKLFDVGGVLEKALKSRENAQQGVVNHYHVQIDKLETQDAESFMDLVPSLFIQYKK